MFPEVENNSLALTNFQGGCEILIRKFQGGLKKFLGDIVYQIIVLLIK